MHIRLQNIGKKNFRTSTYFLLGVFIITLVTTGIYIFVRGRQIVAEEKKLVMERDVLFARTLAQSISIYIKANVEAVERLAGSARQHEFTIEKLYPLTENAVQNSSAFFAMSVVDTNGNIVAGYNKLAANAREKLISGINISDRDYYKELIATRKIVISDTIRSRVAPYVPTVAIAAPIFDNEKKLSGMAIGGLSLESLYRLAEAALGSEHAIPVVVDKQGQVIIHSNSTFIKEQKLLKDFEPAKRALRGEVGFTDAFIDTDGKERSAAYTQVPELGWGVWIAQDTTQFSQARQRVAIASVIWGAATLFGVFLIFIALSRLLFRPFDHLHEQVVNVIEKNNFDAKIEVRGLLHSHEIVHLTDSFNLLIEKVRKSFDEQQEALDMKSQFLTVTTHAFRTPLNVLQWTLTSIVGKISSYSIDQRTELLDLYESTQRLSLGFENLFTALEIQEKTIRTEYKKVNVSALVEDVIQKILPIADKTRVTIHRAITKEILIAGDMLKLQRVFEILFANALFYNRIDGTVRAELSQDKGSTFIKITDSGIGMSHDDLKHIFEPFFRGKKAALKYPDGLGLGLFIVKAFVDLHQGSIDITSKEAEGTTVAVRLPLRVSFAERAKK